MVLDVKFVKGVETIGLLFKYSNDVTRIIKEKIVFILRNILMFQTVNNCLSSERGT